MGDFIDQMIVTCANGLGRIYLFLATLWVRLIFVLICIAVLCAILGLVGI